MAFNYHKMLPGRREALQLLGGSLLLPTVTPAWGSAGDTSVFISAASVSDEHHQVRGFDLTGSHLDMRFSFDLPGRAHHVAINPQSGDYVAVARRPGTWLARGSFLNPEPPVLTEVPDGHYLCGHGIYAADGQYFYTLETEEADSGDNGRIGVWEVSEYGLQRVSELNTYGVGPHEGSFLPDGKTLVVANGGIRTSTDASRTKLNIDTMQPSLVYVDAHSGRLVQRLTLAPEYHQSSIRHLDVNDDGLVALAMQFEGEPFLDVPLVGMHRLGEAQIRLSEIPLFEQQQLNQYCGSVRFDESGRYVAVSGPRGNRITFWDADTNTFIRSIRSRDGCGVCALDKGFLFTSGTGRVAYYDLDTEAVADFSDQIDQRYLWDNHLSRV